MQIFRGIALEFEPAAHEDIDDPGCLKKVLIRKMDIPAGRIQMINWAMLKPQRAFTAHYHDRMSEVFIIVAGRAEIHVGEETDILIEGDAVVIPQRAVHRMTALDDHFVCYIAMGIAHDDGGRTVVG
jgi:mannose-6-phosphate isomerase-like protein (cupin superfamily)